MQSCGMSTIKYILFAFNFVFALSGLGILIAGALVLADMNEYGHFIEGRIQAPPIVLIVTGALIFLIASLGCYGAIKESPTLLIAFAVLLGVIFILELAVGISACLFKADLDDILKENLRKSINRSSRDDILAWDKAQSRLNCCGIEGTYDWTDNRPGARIPASCCIPGGVSRQTNDCFDSPAHYRDKYYTEGCLPKLKEKISSNASILITVGISVAFIQLLGIVLACWLASAIRRETIN